MSPAHCRIALLLAAAACGDNHERGLDDFLPPIPPPTGEAQSVYAGTVTTDNAGAELIPGPAASGIPGDLYIRNARGRFIIQAASRVIGVVPQGGNLVDAQPIGPDGPIGDEQFGELSSIYILGRTCEHDRVEVVQDGAGGGAAAVVARGKSAPNDWFNLKGMGIITIPSDLDPDIPDQIECATTYILQPDSPTLEVYWTFYNAGDIPVRGPFAAFSDTGGAVDTWNHGRGFERIGVESLSDPDLEPTPTEYAVFQGPAVAYGLVPQYAADAALRSSASILITGVSIVIYGTDEIFDFLRPEGTYFSVDGKDGVTHAVKFIVGQDAADIDEVVRAGEGAALHELSGTVAWASGEPAAGARVGVFADADSDGEIGDADTVVSYADAAPDGRFSARLPAGSYLVRADLRDLGRSAGAPVDLTADRSGVDLEIADLVHVDYSVVDDETDELIPARIAVVGVNPVAADSRLFSTSDTLDGVVDQIQAVHGTSLDGGDRRIALVPGGRYRVIATRGTEWSAASEVVEPVAGGPDGSLELRLRRVVDTTGYLASEYHVHSIGSFDSTVDWPSRIASAVANGVELFASTEHDYVADLQPLVEELGLARLVRVLPGTEVTPFAYGHFNGYPIDRDPASPSGGAIDWARGAGGFALTPREVFDQLRAAGAQLVQVNHPRSTPGSLGGFLQYFDRAGLEFDYDARAIAGDLLTQPVPNEWLRLPPEVSMWDLSFNALEVWNQLGMKDTNEDGRREPWQLDVVMKDWFNFVSFGFPVTPMGNSDTHSLVSDTIGVPRTMVRVEDDSGDALESGGVVDALLDTLLGRGPTPHDIVVTNGPHIRVTRQGSDTSAIGQVLAGAGGEVTLAIDVQSPRWAAFDTIEVFANAIPDVTSDVTVLQPIACFTVTPEADLPPEDPCAQAPLGSAPLDVNLVAVAPGFQRREASVALTLSRTDPLYPEGGDGEDVWVVVRVRGDRAVYPLLLNAIDGDNLETLVSGTVAEVEAALDGIGVTATAFTAPIYLDLDGGGYRARFAPE
ncbi:MAG TPA: CehA/McbA family metallohydrolase [Kofleriaceae bacterium]|nr:CehA/McbA family metallohydrolase [Kofleriaceae bacterium]